MPLIEIEVEFADGSLTPVSSMDDEKGSDEADRFVFAGKFCEHSQYAGLNRTRAYGKSVGFM